MGDGESEARTSANLMGLPGALYGAELFASSPSLHSHDNQTAPTSWLLASTNHTGANASMAAQAQQWQLDAGGSGGQAAGVHPIQYNELNPSDLDAIVNVTREYPFEYAMVMFGYLMPFVLIITVVTNSLVVAVLYQRHMRTPTNIVLFTMAIVDLCTLMAPFPWYLYIYTLGNHDKFLYPPSLCYLHHVMTDVVPVFFHTSSIWLALLLASQRYIYVCHPTLARTWCTVPKVKRAIFFILMTALLHQLTRFFDNTFEPTTFMYKHVQHWACQYKIADWVGSLGVSGYYTTYFTFRILFVFIIPCGALITLNWLLFRALKRAEDKRTQLLKTKFRIVDVEPNERHSHHNFSVSGYGARDVSSCVAPTTGIVNRVLFGRQATLVGGSSSGGSGPSSPSGDESRGSPTLAGATRSLKSATPLAARHQPSAQHAHQATRLTNEGQMVTDLDANQDTGSTSTRRNRRHHQAHRQPSRNSERSLQSSGTSGRSSSESRSCKEDDSICPECAAYEEEVRQGASGGCRSCSATLNGLARGDGTTATEANCEHRPHGHHRHMLQHQTISQCSSILGGATYTLTNEEDISSSCLATQNISSSMFNPADGAETEETDEAANEAEDDEPLTSCDEDDNQEERDLEMAHMKNHRVKKVQAWTSDIKRMVKSGSIGSRLACGCSAAKASALRRVRMPVLAREQQRAGEGGRNASAVSQSYSMIEYHRAANHGYDGQQARSQRTVDTATPSGQRQGNKSTSSDPCINCSDQKHHRHLCATNTRQNGNTNRTNNGPGRRKAAGHELSDSGVRIRSANNLPTSLSDHGHARSATESSTSLILGSQSKMSEPNLSDSAKARSKPHQQQHRPHQPDKCSRNDLASSVTAQPATATTTTTVYSANTNSMGSLVQAANNSNLRREQLSTGATNSARPPNQRTKSPSVASCTTGRGSRATLFGAASSTAVPLVVTGQQNPQIQATIPTTSTRTMDSNRTTLMLVVVVTVFLIVEVPVAIVTIMHVVLNLFDVFRDVEQLSSYLNYIKLFTNFFIMISYSVNFTIYCSMSKKFRETFRDLVRYIFFCGKRAKRKRAKRMLYQSQQQHSQYNAGPHQSISHQFAAPNTTTAPTTTTTTNNNAPKSNHNTNSTAPNNRHLDSFRANRAQSELVALVAPTSSHLNNANNNRTKNLSQAERKAECNL